MPTTQETELEKSLREKWAKFLRSPASMANSIEEAHADWWLKEFALSHQALLKEKREEVLKRVGFLRQWLNEDRITDPERMVSNEQILSWLTPIGEKEI